jgi:hypothetical protein
VLEVVVPDVDPLGSLLFELELLEPPLQPASPALMMRIP